jgi:Domain of unknown function (DUF4337)
MPELMEGSEMHDDGPLTIPVAVTVSILAMMVALVTLLGHRASTEELLLQTKATDQWAFFQAKSIRQHEMQSTADLLSVLTPADKEKAEAMREQYAIEVERYDREKDEASEKATELEKEKERAGRREDRFDAGEVMLEIALIISALTLLTKKKLFWFAGICLGLVGVIVAASAFLLP